MRKGEDTDPYFLLRDPGGPKTSGSGTLDVNITFRLLFFVIIIIISIFSLQDRADGMVGP
jgi:hypothetical protein